MSQPEQSTQGGADWPASPESRWAKPLSWLFLRAFSRYRVIGKENIPSSGPYLMVSNHLSYWDIPAMNYSIPFGAVGLAARKYRNTWKRPFFELYAVIWVTQYSADREALRAAMSVLKQGGRMAIAPEGRRSETNALIEGTDGAAYLATRTNVPIVPGAVWGTERMFKHPRPVVTARFGKPFTLPEGRAKSDQLKEYTTRIMCALAALLPEEYHGVYAGHPLIDEMRAIVT